MALTEKQKKRNLKLMEDIIKYLQKHEMFEMITIYVNGHKYTDDKRENAIECSTKYGPYYDNGPCDVTTILEYNNPDILTMSFEGPLYHAYNGYSGHTSAEEDIQKICNKYNLYPEQGYAWSLAVYE